MCGRYALKTSTPELARRLGVEVKPGSEVDTHPPSFNIAPTQNVLSCRSNRDANRELTVMRWGLIPSWSKGDSSKFSMINARAETITERPAYRTAFRFRRCLIPADGFYEWQRVEGRKQPFFIGLESRETLMFAGVWERWRGSEGESVISCAIITTEANHKLNFIHHRMPVLLDDDQFDTWLDPKQTDPARLTSMLRPYRREPMAAFPVSTFVNKAANNDERCWQPITG